MRNKGIWSRLSKQRTGSATPAKSPRSLKLEELEIRLAPATRIWDGGGSTSGWAEAANWEGNVRPAAGDTLLFPSAVAKVATVNNFAANTRFNAIVLDGDGYSLNGNPIEVGSGGITSNAGGVTNTIGLNLNFVGTTGTRNISAGTNGAQLTISGRIAAAVGLNISKVGQGLLVLSGANTGLASTIFIQQGFLRVANVQALGTTTAPTVVQNELGAAQLQIASGLGTLAEPLRLNGGGPLSDGSLLSLGGNNLLTGQVTLNTDSIIGVADGNLTVQSVINDAGTASDLIKEGAGKLILDPLRSATGNTYRGQTIINAGILTIRHSQALGNSQFPQPNVNDTVVNAFANRSGALQLEFVPNSARVDSFATSTGFRVPYEYLTLNGQGAEGIHVNPKTMGIPGTTPMGALNNLTGNNTWTQDISLWSGDSAMAFDPIYWDWATVGIGAQANTQLTITGNIIDTNLSGNADVTDIPYSLIKTRTGRVVFVNDNTYRGRTEVLEGYLNIRDSRALGAAGVEENGTIVFPGGTLELEADANPDSNPAGISPDGIAHLNTDIVIADELFFIQGTGAGGNGATGQGALRNVRGVNEISGPMEIGTRIFRGSSVGAVVFADRGAWIGVEPDQSPFTQFDLSQLTLSGEVQNGNPRPSDIFKTGAGELVLTADAPGVTENTYTGLTYIMQGWVTARNDRAFGGQVTSVGETRQPETHVAQGAGLVLKRTRGTNLDINLRDNLWLAGLGFNSRFSEMNQQGALLNLSGNNTVAGQINLIAKRDTSQVGIGVNVDPLVTGATTPSDLVLAGAIYQTPLPFRVPRDASGGGIDEDRYLIDTGSISGSLQITYNFFAVPDRMTVYYEGNQIYDSGFISTPGPVTVNVPYDQPPGTGNSTFVEVVMNEGNTGDPSTAWEYNVTVFPDDRNAGITKGGFNHLTIQNSGTYGGSVIVNQGSLRIQNDTALGIGLKPNPTSTNDFAPGTTTLKSGTALEILGKIPEMNGGLSGGIQVQDKFIIDGMGLSETQRITIGGGVGTFTLSFQGKTTAKLKFNSTAAQVQTALNGLTTIGKDGVTVTRAWDAVTNTYFFTVTFQGKFTGQNVAAIVAAPFSGATAQVNTLVEGGLNTITNMADDNSIRGAITANTPFTIDTNADSRLSLWGNISGAKGGFTKNDLGKLVLGGNNTYGGNTVINAGVVNIQTPSPFGIGGASPTQGGTVVANNAQLEVQGDLSIAGEPLKILGNGPDAPTNVPMTWYSQGAGPILNGQTVGNQNVTGRVTSVAVDPRDPNVLYASGASGGLWRSTDNGLTWKALIDSIPDPKYTDQVLFTGSIAIAPTSPNTIYVAMGNPTNSVESYYGRGILKSTDFGKTWTLLPAPNANFDRMSISKIVVDPVNPDVFYVAVQGNAINGATTALTNYGVWRNRNGIWKNLTSGSFSGRFTDLMVVNANPRLSYDGSDALYRFPNNPDRRFVAFALGDYEGDAENAVYIADLLNFTTVPVADDWEIGGFPTGTENVLGVDVPRNGMIKLAGVRPPAGGVLSKTVTMYAPITFAVDGIRDQNRQAGRFREVMTNTYQLAYDAGLDQYVWNLGTWAAAGTQPPANYMGGLDSGNNKLFTASTFGQGWYASTVSVHPTNPAIYFLGGMGQPFSAGPFLYNGTAWTDLGAKSAAPHVNYLASTFDFEGRLVVGTDGGIWGFNSANPGGNWTNLNGNYLQITEFEGFDVNPFDPFKAMGSSLQNGAEIYNGTPIWTFSDSGSGGWLRIHNKNPNIVYHYQNESFRRSTDAGKTWSTLFTVSNFNYPYSVDAAYYPDFKSSAGYPFALDPANPSRLLIVDRDPVSNFFTRLREATDADQAAAQNRNPNFVTIGDSNTGFGQIFGIGLADRQGAFVPDPDFPLVVDKGADTYVPSTIYVLTQSGLFVTKNSGALWVARDAGLPGLNLGLYSSLTVDPRNQDVAYVTRSAFGTGQIFRTKDAGQTWENITGDLPDLPAWKVAINPRNGDLYLGNDNGVYRLRGVNNEADNFTWARFGIGLPNAQVKQVVYNPLTNMLSAGTFGRGLFQIWLDQGTEDAENGVTNTGAIRTISGSTVWAGNLSLSGPIEFRAEIGTQLNVLGSISDATPTTTNTVTKQGVGTLVLGGANNYGGLTQVNEGVLNIRNPNGLGAATGIGKTVVEAGAALQIQSDLVGERVEVSGDGQLFNGVFTGAFRSVANTNTFTGKLVLKTNSTIGVDSGSSLTIGTKTGLAGTGSIIQDGGDFGFVKELVGDLVLNTANSYAGETTINQGKVVITRPAALGTSAAGTVVNSGGQLQVNGGTATSPVIMANESVALAGIGPFGTGALNIPGWVTWTAPLTLFDASNQGAINVGTGGRMLADVSITGDGGLIKSGAGRLVLNLANTYKGLTTVTGGPLRIVNPLSLGTSDQGTQVQPGGTLELVNAGMSILDETLSLMGTGENNNGALNNVTGKNEWLADIVLANSATVAAQAGTTLTLSGDISDLGGANPQSNLTMRSTGKLVLSGTNTYRGNTIIPMGSVQVDGTIGNVQMVQGNWNGQVVRGVLSGVGTVGQINSSSARAIGTIAPGANGTPNPTGILTAASAIWGQSTTFSVQLNGPAAGTNYDQLVVNGNIDLGGARLGVSAVPSLPVGSSYTIIQVVGGTRTGTFAGLANNAVVVLGGLRFRINYTTTTVVLTRV